MSRFGQRIIAGLREVVDFLSGNIVGMPVVVHVPNEKGEMERHTVYSIDELRTLEKERDMDAIDELLQHRMEVLDPTGHTEVTWSADNEDEVAIARETFERMTARGYQAFRPGAAKGERGNRISTFDPSIERMVLFPQLRGG